MAFPYFYENLKGGAYMAHIHNVYDSDKHFIIDAVTMVIQNTSEKVKLSQYNHKSERFTFEIPRYIEGHDMSLCNKVQVHFNNVKSDKTVISKGVYEVDDLEVAEDENTVIFSWLISRKATLNEGTLNFCIRFACIADDATVDYARYTDIYKGITITESLFNSEHVIVDYSDILEAWKQELEELATSGGGLTEVAWEDIKNKPFGEVKCFEDVDFDGIITGNSVTTNKINEFEQDLFYVKVGEMPSSSEEYISKINFCYGNMFDEVVTFEISEENIVKIPKGTGVNVGSILFVVGVDEPHTTEGGFVFPESGLYFMCGIHSDNTMTYIEKVSFKEYVKRIDEKYLPESYDVLKNVTPEDKGKFLRVDENGNWAADTVPNAEEAEF